MHTHPNPALLNDDELNIAVYITTAVDTGFPPTPYQIAKACHRQIPFVLHVLCRLEAFGFIELPPTGYGYIRVTKWAHESHSCRCGQPMRVFAMDATQPDMLSADCWNPACKLWGVTLPLGAHERLTDAQVENYASTTAWFRAQESEAAR